MNFKIKTDKNFTTALNKMIEKYGEEFEILNGFHDSQMNFSDFINAFIDKNVADVTIDANANASNKDIKSLLTEKGKPHDKLFAFNKLFYEMNKKYGLKDAREWLECEYSGAFYMHDASTSTFLPYCYSFDLTRLAKEGLFFLKNYNNQPPKHLTTFLDDVIEFISYFSNRSSGAVGVANILIWTYYFWKKDCDTGYYIKDPDYYLRQNFQKLIYRLNQPFMRVDQSAFVNVSIFDREYITSLFGGIEYPDGSLVLDNIEEIIQHQKVFMEVVSDIRHTNLFTFPVLTYSLLFQNGKFVDEEFARWCSDHNTKWNDSNFFVSDNVNTLSNCCRLLSSTTKLTGFINSIGGTALSIGSVKVNTTNLVRIFYEVKSEHPKATIEELKKHYLERLKERIELSCKILDVQRSIIQRNIEKGLLPNYVDGGVELSKQYSTIGISGMFETVKYMGLTEEDELGNISYLQEGIDFASDIFDAINEVKDKFPVKFSFNIESIPAERAAVILCAKDNALYNRENEDFIYSNQWIPLTAKATLKEKIKLSSILDVKCSGGTILHANLESNFPNNDMAWEVLNKIANAGVIYFAFNTRINVCANRHGFVGSSICSECGGPVVDTYQRIVGYLSPSKSYSKERFKEFSARKWYDIAQEKDEI